MTMNTSGTIRKVTNIFIILLISALVLGACGLNQSKQVTRTKKTGVIPQAIKQTETTLPPEQERDIKTSTPEPSPTALPTPTITPSPVLMTDEALEAVAWDLFLQDAEQFKLIETIALVPGSLLETIRQSPLILIPLRPDFLMDLNFYAQIIPVPEQFHFQIEKVQVYQLEDDIKIELALLANTYNTHQTYVAAMPMRVWGKYGEELTFSTLTAETGPMVTFTATRDDIYPNKIHNILFALEQMAKYQERYGPFLQGYEYSYLNMIGLGSGEFFNYYLDGLNYFRKPIRANGICAMATGLSALLTADGLPEYMVKERHAHRDMYHQGPYSFPRLLVDSAIEFGPADYQKFDFKWKQDKDAYLKIEVQLFSTGVAFSETVPGGMECPADVGMLVSLSFSDHAIEQSADLNKLITRHTQFRESEHHTPLLDQENQRSISYFSLSDANTEKIARQIYDVENIAFFADVVNENETLQDIFYLAETVNTFVEDRDFYLGSYLKASEWYRQYTAQPENENLAIDRVIDKCTFRNIPGEPLQCMGFVMMLADLYPSMGFPNVSKAVAEVAGKMVPDFVYGVEGRFSTGYGEIALVGKSLTIEDYNAGDFFVIKGHPGHVGAILAKKDGRLLVADSNRLWDGRVRFFIVDEKNFDEVFGVEKYIILGHNSPN